MNAIQIPGEYKHYYQRRQKEGKNNMSTLNIIRNKLPARIFAVVKQQTPYVNPDKFAAEFLWLKICFSHRRVLATVIILYIILYEHKLVNFQVQFDVY